MEHGWMEPPNKRLYNVWTQDEDATNNLTALLVFAGSLDQENVTLSVIKPN